MNFTEINFLQMYLTYPCNIATSCWFIMADIPETRISDPDGKIRNDLVGHIS